MATGVNLNESSVRLQELQDTLRNALSGAQVDIPDLTKLRLLMLYFCTVTNISDQVRNKLLQDSKLRSSDQNVLMALWQSKLLEAPDAPKVKGGSIAHRLGKDQISRFKKICKDRKLDLSRFEPRLKELLQQMIAGSLKEDVFPYVDDDSNEVVGQIGQQGLRVGGQGATAPVAPSLDDWSFEATPSPATHAATTSEVNAEVNKRIIIFVIGGITYSELRAVAEVATKGVEIFVGGTSVLTAKRLIKLLRSSTEKDNMPDDDGVDLT